MTDVIEFKGTSVAARALIALLCGPATATEIAQRIGMNRESELYEILHNLRVTRPFNAVFIKEWVRSPLNGRYMPLFALNTMGAPTADAVQPMLNTENTRRKLKDIRRPRVSPAVSAPAETSTPAHAPAASPVRSRAESPRPNPEDRPVASIFDLASRCMP